MECELFQFSNRYQNLIHSTQTKKRSGKYSVASKATDDGLSDSDSGSLQPSIVSRTFFATNESAITFRYQSFLTHMRYAELSENFLTEVGVKKVFGSTVQFFCEGIYVFELMLLSSLC